MHDVLAQKFGPTLKRMREARKLSQSKLAERAGFDHSYVSRLESGARFPTRDAINQLALALGLEQLEQDELLTSAGFMARDISSLFADEPEVAALFALLQDDNLPLAYRESMRRMLRLIAEQAKEHMMRNTLLLTA